MSEKPCVLWTGLRTGNGYGAVIIGRRPDRKVRGAHVVAWEEANGRAVTPGRIICHTCDTPLCVEPSHLYEGTHKQNARDRSARSRSYRGEGNPNHKLTAEEVRAMRARYAAGGVTQEALAAEYGISRAMASFIVTRRHWQEVD